ncbi:MAG: hypothetical protein P1V13_24370 [Rhizobiaceae bacterium]|nr:hypothetical protein [Rhizobiaceae bacterium]
MVKLMVADPIGLGKYLRMVAKDPAEQIALKANPNEKIGQFLAAPVPAGVTIIPNFDTATETYIAIPWEQDILATEAKVQVGDYGFPNFYFSLEPQSSDLSERERAYDFRVGDYVMSRCV